MVVGPDEPFGGCSREDMEGEHWAGLAAVLRRQGVAVRAPGCDGYRVKSCRASGCLRGSAIGWVTASSPDGIHRMEMRLPCVRPLSACH